MKKHKFKKIHIPHINYTVYCKPMTKVEDNDMYMYVEKNSKDISTIYMPFPIKIHDFTTIAHEVVHVLQNICESRYMKFTEETEHMGYLMQYILNEILDYKYVPKGK